MENKFIKIPEHMKQNKDDDFNLVEIINETPHCKKHGAMNKFPNGIWRCLSEYGYKYKEGNTLPTFIDRVCCACCFEPKKEKPKTKVKKALSRLRSRN